MSRIEQSGQAIRQLNSMLWSDKNYVRGKKKNIAYSYKAY